MDGGVFVEFGALRRLDADLVDQNVRRALLSNFVVYYFLIVVPQSSVREPVLVLNS